MTVQALLSRLDRVKQTGRGRWVACCPAHDDKRPSLAITETDDGKVLLHDFGGCSVYDVLAAVGMKVQDLFPAMATPRSDVKSARMPFSYADALRAVSFEAMLAATAACNLSNGTPLTEADKARLLLASRRITQALEVCQCR
ncbi:DNA primase [Pusillimonas sp. ANT_WB101]|nr:DNA primase [Pusillimonas sp. ANT_WB101]